MKIKSLLLVAAAFTISVAANAQETNKDENGKRIYGPYETNAFGDNWFINANIGLNISMDGGFANLTRVGALNYGAGLTVDLAAGKWFTPCFGARLGWAGWGTGNVGGNSKFGGFPGVWGFNYVHADVLWNISHQFAGYKELRRANVVPYFTSGMVFGRKLGTNDRVRMGLGIGAGVMVQIRCSDLISFVPDVRFIGFNGEIADVKGIAGQFSATVGVQFNLPRSNWTRKATTVAAYTAAVADAEAARDAAKVSEQKAVAAKEAADAKADKLAKENEELRKKLAEVKAIRVVDLGENPVAAYFEIGQTKLSDKEMAHLKYNVKTAIAGNQDVKLILTGSADKFGGSNKRNRQLAQKRADYVINLLVKEFGLSVDNFEVVTTVVDGTSPLSRAVIISK